MAVQRQRWILSTPSCVTHLSHREPSDPGDTCDSREALNQEFKRGLEMCHTDTVDCDPPSPFLFRIRAKKVTNNKMQWFNEPSPAGASFMYQFLWLNLQMTLKIEPNFLEKSPWPCSGRSTQQHLIWFLVTRRLRGPSPVCPGRASIFPALCVCVWERMCVCACVCVCVRACVCVSVYLRATAKSSTDPIFSSHVSCPRQQLSHKPPSKASWACLSVLSVPQPPLAPLITTRQGKSQMFVMTKVYHLLIHTK